MVDLAQLRAVIAAPAPHPAILGDSFPVSRGFLQGVLEELEASRVRAAIVDTITDGLIAA
jgi:hypothetical protein